MEGVPAEDALADLGRVLVRPLQEVDEGVAVVAVEAVRALLTGHRHLLHVLRCAMMRQCYPLKKARLITTS